MLDLHEIILTCFSMAFPKRRALPSVTTTFKNEKNQRIFIMVILRTWFKVAADFRLEEPPYFLTFYFLIYIYIYYIYKYIYIYKYYIYMYIYLYIYCMASYITYYFLSGWRQIIPIFLFLLSWAPFIISMLKAYCLQTALTQL